MIPDTAIAGIRHTVDEMIGSYLARRGGQRYRDKSLGAARFADLLLRVYPQTKFLCLYRHPMDMIASGIEACPWGTRGYGFDSYIGASPGNTVLALARYWNDNTAAILGVEDRFPGSCHRVRYEDLVADPGAAVADLAHRAGQPGVGLTDAGRNTLARPSSPAVGRRDDDRRLICPAPQRPGVGAAAHGHAPRRGRAGNAVQLTDPRRENLGMPARSSIGCPGDDALARRRTRAHRLTRGRRHAGDAG